MGMPLAVIGRKIRTMRKKLGFTLETMAQQTGLSKGMLSQVERGLSSPSLETLWKISQSLGTSLAELVAECEEANVRLVRAGERRMLASPSSRAGLQLVAGGAKGALGVVELRLPPGEEVTASYTGQDGEECLIVTSGSVSVRIGRDEWQVSGGDSLEVRGAGTCTVVNGGREPAVILWCAYPFQ